MIPFTKCIRHLALVESAWKILVSRMNGNNVESRTWFGSEGTKTTLSNQIADSRTGAAENAWVQHNHDSSNPHTRNHADMFDVTCTLTTIGISCSPRMCGRLIEEALGTMQTDSDLLYPCR